VRFDDRFGLHLDAHLSDDALIEAHVLAVDSAHLKACAECRGRYDSLTRMFDAVRDDGVSEADAVFTAERLDEQRDRILRRLERQGHPADVLMFPRHSGSQQAARRLLGPARRWVAGAAAAGLVAGLFLGFEVDRRVSASAGRSVKAPASVAVLNRQPEPARPQDEQILTEIEDALTGPTRRVSELRALDAMTTPPEVQEASFVPR
jgi:hypothetical protein